MGSSATFTSQAPNHDSRHNDRAPWSSRRYALKPRHAAACAVLAGLFLVLNYVPLRQTDLWSHVALGQWITRHGRLPAEDPLLPLAEGMPLVDSAWLSQVILAKVVSRGGAVWLSNLFAMVVLVTTLFWARTHYLRTRRFGTTAVATALTLVFGFSRLATMRPEIFGGLCFALLLWMLAQGSPDDRNHPLRLAPPESWSPRWFFLPALFALWANLHGSMIVGFAVLGCCVVGEAIEVLWQQRRILAVLADRTTRRWIVLTELCLAASLLNPYGGGLLVHVFTFAHHPAIAVISEWQPLVVLGVGGREFALSLVVLLVVFRQSRRRVLPTEVLLLAVFAVAAVMHVRMLTWYAPVVMLVLAPHLADISSRLVWPSRRRRAAARDRAASAGFVWAPTLVAGLMVWIAFALSGCGQALLGGQPRAAARLYSQDTPRGLTSYLDRHPAEGLVFNPQWWGDWLVWRGPEHLQVFMTSQMHMVPPHVWHDYQRVVNARPGWQVTLKRYAVSTVIVDPRREPWLAAAISREDGWTLAYQDEQAQLFRRTMQAPPVAGTPSGLKTAANAIASR